MKLKNLIPAALLFLCIPSFSQNNSTAIKYVKFALNDSIVQSCLQEQLEKANVDYFLIINDNDSVNYSLVKEGTKKADSDHVHKVRVASIHQNKSGKTTQVDLKLIIDNRLDMAVTVNESSDESYVYKLKAKYSDGSKKKSFYYISNN